MEQNQIEKVVEMLNGYADERRLALELMSDFTLGETFEVLKKTFINGLNFTWKQHGVELDARNWLVFRRFNLPEEFDDRTFRWAFWDISTIRWVKQNQDRKPDRVRPFIVYNSPYWVNHYEFDNLVEYHHEKGIPR